MRQHIILFLLVVELIAGMPCMPARATERGMSAAPPSASPESPPSTSSATLGANPLPRGCGGVTPPGAADAVCCVTGFVYADGQPIAGAEVRIQNHDGDQVTVVTQVYSGTETRPYYRLSLDAPPLSVQAGDTITVTARYGGATRGLPYLVRPGGQQVDVVLARAQSEGYIFEQQIWGPAEPRQFNSLGSMAVDRAGDVYVVDSGNARVQVFGSDQQFLRQWGAPGSRPGQFRDPAGIAVDNSGNVYVVDARNYRIQKFSRDGQFILAWGSYGSADGQLYTPRAVGVDAAGHVYVTDGDRIQKFSSAGTWLATWDSVYGAIDLSVDPDGNIYVLRDRHIDKFDGGGTLLASWEGLFNAENPALADDPGGISADAETIYVTAGPRIYLFSPTLQLITSWNTELARAGSLAVDGRGYLYAADVLRDRIWKFAVANTPGYLPISWGDTGHADGQLDAPMGAVMSNDKLYVTDTWNNRIQIFNGDGRLLERWGGLGTGAGQFYHPTGIALDAAENVYIVDTRNNRIHKRDTLGNWTVWGEAGSASGQFYHPDGIALDAAGNIYVADAGNNRIQKRDAAGNWTVLASRGGDVGQVRSPHKLAIDGSGNLYVADAGNYRIQKRDAAGNWTVWGSSGDSNQQIFKPYAIGVDSSGRVYVGDRRNGRIHKFTGDGARLATFGGLGTDPGQFGNYDAEIGLSVDAGGKLYVADPANNRVQIFRQMTYTQPIATIQYLSGTTIAASGRLVAIGMGQDSDETPTIAGYRWTSDRDGDLGAARELDLSAAKLSPGAHHLSFAVRDSEGEWSDPVGADLYVNVPPQAQWTMLLYLAGDYADGGRLLNAFDHALDALRKSFRNPYVRIAVQIDGPRHGDTIRLLIAPGSARIPPQVTTLPYGEQAMDDPTALADFVRWGQSSFPAAHYYLSIADHGQGIQGLAWDSTSDPTGGAYLTVQELGQALNALGVAPIDVLHLDACAMNLLEVAYEVEHEQRGQVGMLIASQYLGWDYFAYDAYQAAIGATTSPRELALGVTTRYAALAQTDAHPYTIAALDLSRLPPVRAALDHLAAELTALVANRQLTAATLDAIRQASQQFESNGDYVNNQLDLYVDLVDWTRRVRDGVSSPAVREAAAALLAELTGPQPLIITSKAESNRLPPQYADGAYVELSGSNGLSIFYPLRQDTAAFQRYLDNRLFSFTSVSRWPRFLASVGGVLCPKCAVQPMPGPLASLSDRRRVFLPILTR